MVDDSAFPRLSRYLASLPRRFASYPECQTKGAVLRNVIDGLSTTRSPLPEELSALVRSPPQFSDWIPEVYLWAMVLAQADHQSLSEAAFIDWSFRYNRRLMEGPVYKFLFVMLSTETVLQLAGIAFRSFHRGIDLVFDKSNEKGRCLFDLRFPPRLINVLCLRGLGTGFEASLVVAKAPQCKVVLEKASETEARFLATWQVG